MAKNYEAGKLVITNKNEYEGLSFLHHLSQTVDCIFFVVYGILLIRILVALFAGKSNGESVRLIKFVSEPLYSSFTGFFINLTAESGIALLLPIITAIFIYMFIYLAINGLLTTLIKRSW